MSTQASSNHTGSLISVPQINNISPKDNLSEQQACSNNPPDDTTVHHDNENTSTLESDLAEPGPADVEIYSDDSSDSEWEDIESELEPRLLHWQNLRVKLVFDLIDLELCNLMNFRGYNYEDALLQLFSDWADTYGPDSLEVFIVQFKIEMFIRNWRKRLLQRATKAQIEKSGLEIIASKQLEQYQRDGKVISNCTQECLICLDGYKNDQEIRILRCKHAFHRECIDHWLETSKNNCPTCRFKGVDKLDRPSISAEESSV